MNETSVDWSLQKFGIGQPSGIGLPGESPGYLTPMSDWSATTFPTMVFGQGFSVNAIQMADVFSTIANDGVRMPARIMADADTPAGERVVSERTAKTIREMLERVVADDGTSLSVPYSVAADVSLIDRELRVQGGGGLLTWADARIRRSKRSSAA